MSRVSINGDTIYTLPAAPEFGVQSFADSDTIDKEQGRTVVFTTGASKTLTLPAASIGLEFTVVNVSSNSVTIARAGSDTIVDGTATGATSVPLPAGAKLEISCYAAATWYNSYKTPLYYTGQFTVASGTGSASVTGVGFRPSNIIVFGTDGASASVGMLQIGAASSASTEVSAVMRADATDGNMNQGTGSFYKILDDNDSTVDAAGSLTSFDTDGFTYNRDTSSGSSHTINFIAMR